MTQYQDYIYILCLERSTVEKDEEVGIDYLSKVRKSFVVGAVFVCGRNYLLAGHNEEEGGVLGRRDILDFTQGRSRVTIDPRIPAMPGRSTSGVHRPGRHCLHQARSAVRCWGSRIKGELHPTDIGNQL